MDTENAIANLESHVNMFELSRTAFESAYQADCVLPSYTVAQLYKKMDKVRELTPEHLERVDYHREWYDASWM